MSRPHSPTSPSGYNPSYEYAPVQGTDAVDPARHSPPPPNAGASQIGSAPQSYDYALIASSEPVEPAMRTSTASSARFEPVSERGSTTMTPMIRHGTSRRLGCMVIFPALATFIATAGAALALLGWLLSRRVSPYAAEGSSQFRNAIVADESIHSPNLLSELLALGGEGAGTTMYGLALTTVAVHIVSFTSPFVVSVFAYWLADTWMKPRVRDGNDTMPTPAQYGLTVGLLSTAGFMSVFDTIKYIVRHRRIGPTLSSSFISAFVGVSAVIFVSFSLSVADVWLHTVATTFLQVHMAPISLDALPSFGTDINMAICPGPISTSSQDGNYSNCQSDTTEFGWGNQSIWDEGNAVVENRSATSKTILLGDLSILVPANMSDQVQGVNFTTFGMKASCEPVTNCDTGNKHSSYWIECLSFTPPMVYPISLLPGSVVTRYNKSTNTVAGYNASEKDPQYSLSSSNDPGYTLDSIINPSSARVLLYWGSLDTPMSNFPSDSHNLGWYTDTSDKYEPEDQVWYAGICTMWAYNVSLSYTSLNGSDPQFALADAIELSNFDTTSALLAALDQYLISALAVHLTSALQPSIQVQPDTFGSLLSHNISSMMLGFAAPLLSRINATSGSSNVQFNASRYPLGPLCTILLLLGGYALFALTLCSAAFVLRSRELVSTDGEGNPVSTGDDTELELAQLRLTNVCALVADRFGVVDGMASASRNSASMEHRKTITLGVGLVDEGELRSGVPTFKVDNADRFCA